MKLKSLLLGSAAVLVAVSGARAADAIVVEPEPVEYVRVCDAYGAGWFYIPGTETCLKFDGDVRVQYGFTGYHDDIQDQTSQHEWNYRARLNVRANNETEYGTLSSRIRFVANGSAGSGVLPGSGHYDILSSAEGPSSAATVVDWAVISLAGFRIGFADNYWSTAGGYGYYNARFDGPYGFGNGIFFDYTYASNGFTATLGIEDGNASGEAGAPDIYGGVTYSGSGWYLAGIYYHDSSASAGAWKVRADYDFGSNGFAVGGWYMAD
ncbi:MAG: porin, partial [Nitratireductor sp.]|nr:porin [Nitratireductor sp.]